MMNSIQTMNRRNFLKTGLAAGAGLAVMPGARVQAGNGGTQTVNIALCGIGAQGRVLMNSLLRIPDVRFRAICEIWPYNQRYGERFLARFGHEVNVYADVNEMLAEEDDLDAVIVATPDWVHAPQTIAALEAGCHVYCEKLMSNTIEAAREMVLAAQRTGKLLQIGHQRRSNPRYIHAYEKLLTEAEIFGGPFTHANAQWNRAKSSALRWPERFEMDENELNRFGYDSMHELINWRWFQKYGGGPISDLGAHQIDIFNWFFKGRPSGVMASGGIDYYDDVEHLDNVMAIYDYETSAGVARAFYQVLTTSSALGYFERFLGVNGTLSISENPSFNQAYREAHAPSWDEFAEQGLLRRAAGAAYNQETEAVDVRETAVLDAWDIPVTLDRPIHQPHLDNFFDAIRAGTPLTCPAEEGFASTVTVLRVAEAVKAQKRLAFDAAEFNA